MELDKKFFDTFDLFFWKKIDFKTFQDKTSSEIIFSLELPFKFLSVVNHYKRSNSEENVR